jgi:hypothetical protein
MQEALGMSSKEIEEIAEAGEQQKEYHRMLDFLNEYTKLAHEGRDYPSEKVDALFDTVKRHISGLSKFWIDQAEEYEEAGVKDTAEKLREVAKRVKKVEEKCGSAKSRIDKVIAIDAFASAGHTTGSIIPVAFGIEDYGRAEYFPKRVLSHLAGEENKMEKDFVAIRRQNRVPRQGLTLPINEIEKVPGYGLLKQMPPGPPPRPGLIWKPETRRWVRAEPLTAGLERIKDKKALEGYAGDWEQPLEGREGHPKLERAKEALGIIWSVIEKDYPAIQLRDKEGLHGVVAYSDAPYKGDFMIHYLASSPAIVMERKKRGVGTRLLCEAIKRGLSHSDTKRITLVPVPDAEAYYEKLGFKRINMEMALERAEAENLVKRIELAFTKREG